MLLENEKLPCNFYEERKIIAKLGLGYMKIDVYSNMCILYYKEHGNKIVCSICSHPRYKPTRNICGTMEKDISYKVLRYLPLTRRLQRLYMSLKTTEHMIWHTMNRCIDGTMVHPCDSKT